MDMDINGMYHTLIYRMATMITDGIYNIYKITV